MSLCKDCVSGVRHEGTPEGKYETINGVNTYVATPTIDYPKEKALLFLTDVFGPQLINNKLLADDFARNGFKTYVPDYFEGDPAPLGAFEPNDTTGFDVNAWFPKHSAAQVRPIIDRLVSALREQGVVEFGATGYCFGGRYVFDLAFDNVIKVAVVAHPSLLKSPDDLEKYASTSKAPLLINSAPVDTQFPLEASATADKILGGGAFAPGYKRVHWDGTVHGFAVRGDLSDPKVKTGKEGAFKESVEWLLKYL